MTRPPSPPSSSSSPRTTTEPATSTNSSSSSESSRNNNCRTTTATAGMPRQARLLHHTQNKARGEAFASPRLCSSPLFAVPSVSLNNTHAVSSSIGPLTPPLTLDQQQATHNTTINASSPPSSLPTPSPIPTSTSTSTDGSIAKLRTVVIGQRGNHQKQQRHSIQRRQQSFGSSDVVHDVYCCMFRITLDSKGTIAALCYLPTRFQRLIEFYHTEIPTAYRDLGLGDLLVAQGLQWAETTKLLVIPTCPFVRRYLDRNSTNWDYVVHTESEGLAKLLAAASLSSPPQLQHQSHPSSAPAAVQHEESGAVE